MGNKTDLSDNEKFELVVQEQMDEQESRLHKMIMSPNMQNTDNVVKLLEEIFQMVQGYLMVKITGVCMQQIKA